MNNSAVNSPKDYFPLLCYLPETEYIFAEFLILLIHWWKYGNGIQNSLDFSYMLN